VKHRSVRRKVLLLASLTLAGFVALFSLADPANRYVETFETLQYRDAVNSTALWDTSAGQIRLPPYQPVHLKTIPAADARGVAASGHLAFIAEVGGDITVVDVSDPPSATVVGTYATGVVPLSINGVGSTAYVAGSGRRH
jgi:hypothetical protein